MNSVGSISVRSACVGRISAVSSRENEIEGSKQVAKERRRDRDPPSKSLIILPPPAEKYLNALSNPSTPPEATVETTGVLDSARRKTFTAIPRFNKCPPVLRPRIDFSEVEVQRIQIEGLGNES